MGRLRLGLAVALAGALACNDAGGPPPDGLPRAQLSFVVQDSTYKPLLAARDSFWARVGSDRQIRLFYQGNTPTDTGPEFLRFEVANDALLRRPDGSAFGPNDSILITVTVVDPKQFWFDFKPSGLQFNPDRPARLKVRYEYAQHDFDRNGTIDSADAEIEGRLDLWQREPPDTLWFRVVGAVKFEELDEFDANLFSFSQYAVAW
jgi:hypothetical protein